jgi:transcription-repair coupling factor (superfamily II helicase)
MVLDQTLQALRETPGFRQLVAAIQSGETLPNQELARAVRLPLLAALHAELQSPLLLVVDRMDRALSLQDELGLWTPGVRRLTFPEPNPLFYENAPWGENTRRDRAQVLTSLARYHLPGQPITTTGPPGASLPGTSVPPLIVASTRALMPLTLPRRDFLKATQVLRPEDRRDLDGLLRQWVKSGYEVANTVVAPGQCARRGGILDVWPPGDPHPTRIEFFGDEIDTLRSFDPSTQRTHPRDKGTPAPQLLLTPAREYLADETARALLPPLPSPVSPGLLDPVDQELSEFHLPLLNSAPASLLDYLPRQALVVIEDFEALEDTVHQLEDQATGLRQDAIRNSSLPEDFPIPYLTWGQIQDTLGQHQHLTLGPVRSSDRPPLSTVFSPNPRFAGRIKPLLEHLTQAQRQGGELVVVSRQAGRLSQLWDEQAAHVDGAAAPQFVQGSLAEGWVLDREDGRRLHLLTDGEIFGWRRPQPRKRPRVVSASPEAEYTDLQAGDWVVHIDHGVGRFNGLVQRMIEGTEREYLAVEYAQGDQLFVPVYQADRLTRYVGPDGRTPNPSRLGGVEWRNAKARVHKAVEEVAEDLLDLYASRQTVQGHAFSPDNPWQRELEASFPYIETEDQHRVIAEVKRDMEAPRPMDRLICGDVGYGKTEVALRAAFKAVMDGKQVALLVPTTVLAQQHYDTFRERLAPFPVEVEMLSRFRSPAEQREILEKLSAGLVDIVIGTHRLLQLDVVVKDLGLLVIDEEQRFGVTHKETLKRMRTEVDVLTMTATPIPRTLYMALTGVRDISMITTPPDERLPVITHVGPYSQRLIRQAILREIERGGQVFYVHNRVRTIRAVHNQLSRLVPEARLAIAHGQMAEDTLARRMRQFNRGEVDVLLSTSIIESGLDIPNANTLIVDRADTFGLAQLYQLRGRVGRGAQRAFAYFFRHRRLQPTLEGRQRLETIAENTQLGSGFSIAMRDLEIRGTGDILGTRQHGHIAAVGFHLYTRLLAEAVQRLREGREAPSELESLASDLARPMVSVDLPLPSSIPSHYVPEQSMRLRLYRRMADLHTIAEVEALAEEFEDRFGPLPQAVENLLFQLKVKLTAETAGLASVSSENGQIVLRFPPEPARGPGRSLPALGAGVRSGKNALWLTRRSQGDWAGPLMDLLNRLAAQPQP